MAAAEVQRLTFDHDLRHAYTPIQERMQTGGKILTNVLEVIQMRIDAEKTFTNSLKKICDRSNNLLSLVPENETLRMYGLEAMCTDVKNEHSQRVEFLSFLRNDVRRPLQQVRDTYHAQNKSFNHTLKSSIGALKKQQNEFAKLKAKYDKVVHSENGGSANTKSKKQQLLAVKKRFNEQQIAWKQHNEDFEANMAATLRSMESNENKRLTSMQDALTNWSAFICNFCLNRSYDVRNLAENMAQIKPEQDLQQFMRSTLESNPILPPAPPSTYYRRISVSLKLPNGLYLIFNPFFVAGNCTRRHHALFCFF